MARTLKGARYAEGANPALVAFLTEQLPFLAFSEAMEFYASALPRMAPTEIALLGCNDRFFLLTGLCNRVDAIHPWIYDRCREVEAEPDGYLDLWSRFHYKAVDVDEAVPTPQGWRRHGELVPGDFVFGPDGHPTQVVARTPVFTDADCYRVTFCDGYSVVVSGEHLWTVNLTDKSRIDGTNRRRKWKVRTIDTRSLKDEVYRSQSTPTRRYPTVTVAGALAYAAVDLPVHPYVLGVWLGDGTTGGARVTVGRQDVEEMRELIASCGVGATVTQQSNAASIRIGSGERWKKSSSDVATALRSLGVYRDKKIPAIYQRASIEQRKALLQGLMDTDGSCHKDHGQCIFCSANEVLAADVLELALGLGLKATLKQRRALYQGSPRSYWQVQFLGQRSDPPFRLSRKVERCKEEATQQVRRVVNVTKVASRPVSCIQVARDDGLYVIGRHCVTTHNSSIITFAGSIQEILIDPETCIVIFSNTKDIARPFLIQIKEEFETNEKLKALYPDVLYEHPAKQAPLWSNEGIIVKRKGNPKESTVEAHGLINALPTGKHFPVMVYDDAINERNVTNPEQIRKAKERVELSMPIGIGEKTRRRFVGTRYSYADTYGQMIEEGIAKPRIYPATDDGTLDGKPVFMTQEAWDDAKRSMRSTIAAQMLQNPLAGNENTFKVSWLRPYWVRPIMMTVYIMGDPSRGRSASSDRTALAVVGIDTLGNKYLLDGYCHRMPLSERWRKVKELRKKWVNHPGVQSVKVGYERYGMQSDDEYFAEKMILDRESFDIETLGWTGERGRESKTHRVERLEPDFRNGAFFVPGKVWHDAHKGGARWSINEGSDEIEYRQDPGQHRQERQVRSAGELHRIVEPIRRIDEDGNIYDLTRVFFEEFRFFPFSPRDDFIDAMSRIYDMDPLPARPHEKVVVEDHIDA